MSEVRMRPGEPEGETGTAARLFVSPRARRVARERGLNLAHIRGSGPRGRIVAADVRPAPEASERLAGAQVSALGIEFSLVPITALLAKFSSAGLGIDLEDVVIRAASAALSVASQSTDGQGRAVCLEQADGTLQFDDASTMSFSVIHRARSDGSPNDSPQHTAALSIRVLNGPATPILLPPLPGFNMRLALAIKTGSGTASGTLFFSDAHIAVESAMSILESLRLRLEEPVLLLL